MPFGVSPGPLLAYSYHILTLVMTPHLALDSWTQTEFTGANLHFLHFMLLK